jgi:hypothetical protein
LAERNARRECVASCDEELEGIIAAGKLINSESYKPKMERQSH